MSAVLEQKVKQWMTREVLTVKPSNTVAELLDILEKYGIHGVPVVNAVNHVVGVVSMTDVVMTEVDNLKQPAFYFTAALSPIRKSNIQDLTHRQIGDIMTKKVFSIDSDATLKQASETFVKHSVQRLVVLDEQQQLAGILSVTDILIAIANTDS